MIDFQGSVKPHPQVNSTVSEELTQTKWMGVGLYTRRKQKGQYYLCRAVVHINTSQNKYGSTPTLFLN